MDNDGESPLHLAARAGPFHISHTNITKIQRYYDLKTFNNPTGKEEITKMLIARGADVLAKDKLGETAASLASMNGNR